MTAATSEWPHTAMTEPLEQFELRQSDDDVKTDLELTCINCDEHLCDAEDADILATLVRVALGHRCEARP